VVLVVYMRCTGDISKWLRSYPCPYADVKMARDVKCMSAGLRCGRCVHIAGFVVDEHGIRCVKVGGSNATGSSRGCRGCVVDAMDPRELLI